MKNRILSMVLAVCMAFTMMPVAAFAETAQIPQLPHSHPSIDSGIDNSVGGSMGNSMMGNSIDSGKAAATRQAKAGEAWDGTTKTEVTPTTTGSFKTYNVTTGAELAWIAQEVNSGKNADFTNISTTVKLAADIDLGGHTWTPIGKDTSPFVCNFNGVNLTVSSFKTDSAAEKQGLFGEVGSSGKIDNLIVNGTVTGTTNVGGIAGYNSGTITGCRNTGTVNGTNYVGGIVGNNSSTTITGCSNSGTVNGTNYVGGIVGNNSGTIRCSNSGTVTGTNYVGGIVGYNSSGTITSCNNSGTVSGTGYVGGIVGENEGTRSTNGTITSCSNNGAVNGTGSVGGIAGSNSSNAAIQNCYNTGSVTADTGAAGGIAGSNHGTITDCSNNSGAVESSGNEVGGIAGNNKGTITSCYNTGTVKSKGNGNVGGIAGSNSSNAAIQNCYNTGAVNGTEYVGGIAGSNDGTIKNCYNTGSVTADSTGAAGGITSITFSGSTVENCVSLGISVSGKNGNVGRVVGGGYGTPTNNKARSDMLVNGAAVSGAATDVNGEGIDVSKNPALSTVFGDFDAANTWVVSGTLTDTLPTLKNVPDPTTQNPKLPERTQTDISLDISFTDGSATWNGSGQAYEKAKRTSTGETANFTYAYAVNGTGSLSADGKPMGVGSYTVTATYTTSTEKGSKTATFTITAKEVTGATVTVSGSHTYTGTPIVPYYEELTVKDSSTTYVYNTDYTYNTINNTNAGEATVDVSFKGNYSGTATGKFTIAKADIKIDDCIPNPKVYDGKKDATIKEIIFIDLSTSTQVTGMVIGTDYSVGSPIYIDANVGKDKAIMFVPSLIANEKTNNYSLTDSHYVSNKGEITKANYAAPPTIDISIQTGEVRSGTVTMADLFGKAAPADAAFGAVTAPAGAKLMDSVTSASSGIAYTSKNNPAGTSASDIYKVKISSKNYNDFDATITFKTENRQTVAITGLTAATGLTYNGKPQNGCTGTVQVEGNKVPVKELVYTYTGTGSTTYSSTTAPTNAGDYKLVVSVNESNKSYTGAHSVINFTIAKKALSISTKTYKGYQYEELPVLNNTEALVYDGFADGDGMDGINNTLKASYTVSYATGVNSNTVGDKIIKVIVLGTETNTNYNITLTDGKLIVYKAGTKENPPAALPTTILSTPVVVTEQNDPSKKLRVITANLYDDEATLVSTWLRSQSGISSSDLLYAQEIDLQVSSDGINWAKATARDVKNGKLMAVMPLPKDTSPTTHSFLFFHFKDGASKAAEKLEPKYDAKSNTLSVQVSSLSPFAIVATKKGSSSTGGGSGSSANDTDEYAFWTSAKAQVEGFSGTVINLNAGNNDKMPESFMEALRKNNKVNLVISWKGDNTITIPAGKAPKREATRIYYPLSQLAELYKDIKFVEAPAKPANNEKAKQNLNPETGGTAYIKYADGKREPVSGGSITIVAPKKEKPTYALPTVGEKAITPPSEGFEAGAYAGTPDARRASGKHWYMATIAAMLAAAAVGSSVWFWKNKRKEDNE